MPSRTWAEFHVAGRNRFRWRKFPFIPNTLSEYAGVVTNIARPTRSPVAMEPCVHNTPSSYLGKTGSSGRLTAATLSPKALRGRTARLISAGMSHWL